MSGPATAEVEHVVLLDDLGRAIGRARKADVHGPDTPLHLAFSCYVFDTEQRLLLTQRAWHKVTWPGVWTNTCCGHPAPGEPFVEAVRRRTQQELGLVLDDLRLLLPEFRYRVAMADGTVENELCPVFVASTAGPVRADPAEVAAHRWEPWAAWRDDVLAGRADVSPWSVLQVGALPAEPYAAPAADPARLPPAARGVEVRAGLELRPATEEDVDFLTDLVLDVTRAQGRFPADADEDEYRAGFAAWTREQVAGELPGSTTYVLRRDDARVGRLRLVRTAGGDRARRDPAAARRAGPRTRHGADPVPPGGGSARHARRRAGQPPRASALRATGVRPRRPGRPRPPAALGAARRLSHGLATPAARSSRAGTASTSWRARPTSRSRVVPGSRAPATATPRSPAAGATNINHHRQSGSPQKAVQHVTAL